MVADFARDLADCAITVAASRDQFIRNSAADEGVRPRAVDHILLGAGFFVFPLMLIYAAVNYSVFRGKARPSSEHTRRPDLRGSL